MLLIQSERFGRRQIQIASLESENKQHSVDLSVKRSAYLRKIEEYLGK